MPAFKETDYREILMDAEEASAADTEELPETYPAETGDPVQVVLRKEQQQALNRALVGLREDDRLLFYRKYFYMQSTAQIAAELGTTERSVEGRLYRIRQRLKKQLEGV